MNPALILFDIDGTLLLSGRAGLRAMTRAFADTFGITNAFEGQSFGGRTDSYLVSTALRANGMPDTPDQHERFRQIYRLFKNQRIWPSIMSELGNRLNDRVYLREVDFEAKDNTISIIGIGVDRTDILQFAINMDKFKAALDSGTHKSKVDADMNIGNDAGINGTPAIVINGYYLSGAQPAAAFKKLINRALKDAGG